MARGRPAVKHYSRDRARKFDGRLASHMHICLYVDMGIAPASRPLSADKLEAVKALSIGTPIEDALAIAGYKTTVGFDHQVITRADKERLRRAVESRLVLVLIPRAIALYMRVIVDESAPLKLRLDVARDILDRGGFVVPKERQVDLTPALEDMTRDQLVAFIQRAEERRAALATPVSASDSEAVDAQLADMLE